MTNGIVPVVAEAFIEAVIIFGVGASIMLAMGAIGYVGSEIIAAARRALHRR